MPTTLSSLPVCQSAQFCSLHKPRTARSNAVLDEPCPTNPVAPMLYVAAAAVTDVAHTSRRLY